MNKVALDMGRGQGLARFLPWRHPLRPHVPAGTRVFAIGDIHGRLDLLLQLLAKIRERIAAEAGETVLVFLGDYVDRGPDSKGVLDCLMHADLPGEKKIFLRGNHEQAVLDFVADPRFYLDWRNFGAPETLRSYGVQPPRETDDETLLRLRDEFVDKCPPAHLRFLKNLPLAHREGGYLFVHAGLRPGVALEKQSAQDMLWIRDEFLQSTSLSDFVVVHGHCPNMQPVTRPNRLGIDTGAYATGCLTAAVLEEDELAFIST